MKPSRHLIIILVGFVLVLLGAFLPLMMVMRILTSTFFLNFLSYTLSLIGLFMGIYGSAMLVQYRRSKNKDIYPPPDVPTDHRQDW